MNITEGQIIIKEFMHNGERIKVNSVFDTGLIEESKIVSGGLTTKHSPFACPSCGGNYAFLCRDGDDWLMFCGEKQCMKNQSIASKAKNNERKQREQQMENGVPLTGAKKFAMGSTYQNASFPKWMTDPKNHRTVSEWMNNSSPFLICYGGVGTGKSYMCACILNYFFDQRKNVYYTNHRRFISDLQNPISENKSSDDIMLKYCQQNILIFDDLGAATNSEWQKEKILELIDYRYSSSMKTIITSNFNRLQLKDFLGERTLSRLFDKKNTILEMYGEDRRQNPELNDPGF